MADFYFQVDSQTVHARVEQTTTGLAVKIGERAYRVQAQMLADGQLNLLIDGARSRAFVGAGTKEQANEHMVWLNGQTWRLARHRQCHDRRRWSSLNTRAR